MFSAELMDAGGSRFTELPQQAAEKLASAESCTGGVILSVLTEIAASSDFVERGFITYSNTAKIEMLGVPAHLLANCGAVSKEVALAMAQGALQRSHADLSVSVTGAAGPGGGTSMKPVDLVHLAVARRQGALLNEELQLGDLGRSALRIRCVKVAFELLQRAANS
jgi:nicotinamide-nucleotide amidase